MTTVGQKTTEFLIRAERYLSETFLKIVQEREDGQEYESMLYQLEDLFSFLVELQSLYNQWSDRDILTFIDYWDDECNLKSIQGAFPDPYKSYDNGPVIIQQTNVIEVPDGAGFIYRTPTGGTALIRPEEKIISDYDLG